MKKIGLLAVLVALAGPTWAANGEARPPQVSVSVSKDAVARTEVLQNTIIRVAADFPQCNGVRFVRAEDRDHPDIHLTVMWKGEGPRQLAYAIMDTKWQRVSLFIAEDLNTPLQLACLAAKGIQRERQ